MSRAATPFPNRIVGLRTTTEQGTNPKDNLGLAKVPLSLIPRSAKVLMAMGLGIGAIKYGEYNWRVSKVRLRVYLEALERHADALLDGEDLDPDTGLPHIAFILATSAIIADATFGTTNGSIDDRPLPGNGGKLIQQYNNWLKNWQTVQEAAHALRNAQSDLAGGDETGSKGARRVAAKSRGTGLADGRKKRR